MLNWFSLAMPALHSVLLYLANIALKEPCFGAKHVHLRLGTTVGVNSVNLGHFFTYKLMEKVAQFT